MSRRNTAVLPLFARRPGFRLGTICLYEAVSPEAISRHAANTGMSAEEIFKVADTVIVREDPVSA